MCGEATACKRHLFNERLLWQDDDGDFYGIKTTGDFYGIDDDGDGSDNNGEPNILFRRRYVAATFEPSSQDCSRAA